MSAAHDTGTELVNPNFAAMAEAVGIKGIRIEEPGDVRDGLAAVLEDVAAQGGVMG